KLRRILDPPVGVTRRRDRMSRRGKGEDVGDQALVEVISNAMVDSEAMIRRPVPEQWVSLRLAAIPVPFHLAPKLRRDGADFALRVARAIKVLASREDALD